MTKVDLINKMADVAGVSKAVANKLLDAFIDSITNSLKKGQKVTLVGFGTFSTIRRKSRKGRNPRTGEEIAIPPVRVPKFSAGKALKLAVRK